MLRRTLLAISATIALASPSLAQDRLECKLWGDDYPDVSYRDGSPDTWWIEGETLRQAPAGSAKAKIPGLVWMKILVRDEALIRATWSHELVGDARHTFDVDLLKGTVVEQTTWDRGTNLRENHGTCRLVIEAET